MKIKFIIPLVLLSTAVFAATYKITPGGSVISPNGTTVKNYYNNYSSQKYVQNQTVKTGNIKHIEIVMDYSGSMTSWIKAAKNSMKSIISQLPTTTNVGFRVFGQKLDGTESRVGTVSSVQKQGNKYVVKTHTPDNTDACSATKQVSKILPVDYNNLINGMNSVALGGATPMVLALQKTVYNDFLGIPTSEPKKIVLVTDGGENCGGDPCAFARQLNRSDIQIDVVLVSSDSKELMCLSRETGGSFYTPDTLSEFSKSLIHSVTTTKQTPVQNRQEQSYEFVDD